MTMIRHKLTLAEQQDDTVSEIARNKALQAFAILGEPVAVEDGGFFCDDLDELPGPNAKQFGRLPLERFLRLFRDGDTRLCSMRSTVAFAEAGGEIRLFSSDFRGRITGLIGREHSSQFSEFSRIFIPEGYDKPITEFTDAEMDELRRLKLRSFDQFAEWYAAQA